MLLNFAPPISNTKSNQNASNVPNIPVEDCTDTECATTSFADDVTLPPSEFELFLEKDTSVADFALESVYDIDSFEQSTPKNKKHLAPPPDFQKALQTLPESLRKDFKEILHGDIIGIWPIKTNFVLKTPHRL